MAKKKKKQRRPKPQFSFEDYEGREYTVAISLPMLRAIRDELDIDLGKPDQFVALHHNWLDAVNVLYMVCMEQASGYGLDDREFAEGLGGESFANGWKAFQEAYLAFCPSHQAKILRQLMAATEKAELMGAQEVQARLEALMGLSGSPTSFQPSSESTLTVTHSEN